MKRLLTILVVASLFAGCTQEINKPADGDTVTFHVSIPNPVLSDSATRFSDGGGAANVNASYELRVTMQAVQAGVVVETFTEYIDHTVTTIVDFEATVVSGSYDLLFWADFVDATTHANEHYDVTSLLDISKASPYTSGHEADAYSGKLTSQTIDAQYEMPSLTLTRPLGRLEVYAEDFDWDETVSARVTYSGTVITGYNVAISSATETSVTAPSFTATLSGEQTEEYEDIIFDYIVGGQTVSFTVELLDDEDKVLAAHTFQNIPVIENKRSKVKAVFTETSNVTVSSELDDFLSPVITVGGVSMGQTITLTADGLPVVTFEVTENPAVIHSSLLIPETEYEVAVNGLVTTAHTTPTLNRDTVTVLTAGNLYTSITAAVRNDCVYLMPGSYTMSTNCTVSQNLFFIGSDPSLVQVTTGTMQFRPAGTLDYVKFHGAKFILNGQHLVRVPSTSTLNCDTILFSLCEVDSTLGAASMFQYAGTDAATIDNFIVEDCLVYSSGAGNYYAALQIDGTIPLIVSHIRIARSTFVNIGRGLITFAAGTGYTDFPYSIEIDHVTGYKLLNTVQATNMAIVNFGITGSSQKSLAITNSAFYLGDNYASNPTRCFWLMFAGGSSATDGQYPQSITVTNSYRMDSQNASAQASVYGIQPSTTAFAGTAAAFWQNPTTNPASFDFTVIGAGVTGVGDTRWVDNN